MQRWLLVTERLPLWQRVGLGRRWVHSSRVRDADPDTAPPEMRMRSGRTFFVPAPRADVLTRFCQENAIPVVRRPDVWGDLLEPFVDTRLSAQQQAAILARLARFGLDEALVTEIRERVGPMMLAFNAWHQDWYHLGLADLLDARRAVWVPYRFRRRAGRYRRLRDEAMRIADLPTTFRSQDR